MATPRTESQRADREHRRIVRECRAAKIQLVRFLYCGNDGVIRGKACHTRFLPSYLESGIGLTVAMQSFNMLDQLVARSEEHTSELQSLTNIVCRLSLEKNNNNYIKK